MSLWAFFLPENNNDDDESNNNNTDRSSLKNWFSYTICMFRAKMKHKMNETTTIQPILNDKYCTIYEK